MAERNISRPWSEEEDALLRAGVAEHGEIDNWKTIALTIPGRTNKACRKRWLHSLQPNVKKTAWSSAEDELLIKLYTEMPKKWSAIARNIPGRTDDACSKRYREALDPDLKKDQWTVEEDRQLLEAYDRLGGKWTDVGRELQRGSLACRNRWRLLERRRGLLTSHPSIPEQATPVYDTPPIIASLLHTEDTLNGQWPLCTYYPPEAYPIFSIDEDPRTQRTFREPTPEILQIPDPIVAPFQFSSSSLSAALSDPPRPPPPLPPVSAFNTPELLVQDIPNDPDRQPSLSPLSQCNGIPEMDDILMSLEDYSQESMGQQSSKTSFSQLPSYEIDSFNFGPLPEYALSSSASPISTQPDLARTLDPLRLTFWKPRGQSDEFYSPSVINDAELSSASSTPFIFSSNLSPNSSPQSISLVDLPATEQLSSNSLLFSQGESRMNHVRRARKSTSKKPKPILKPSLATRLSSTLPLCADASVRPYACAYPSCWPDNAATSLECFSTSGELLDHTKDQHSEEDRIEKPYRCALLGCGKGWKSINGLQYHLQISPAHFTNALYNRFSAQQPGTPLLGTPSSTEAELEDDSQRRYTCPQDGCFKAYRQPSGLRYHISHGHPQDMPTQLPLVPPALERQLPTKAKKLRPKPPPESIAS